MTEFLKVRNYIFTEDQKFLTKRQYLNEDVCRKAFYRRVCVLVEDNWVLFFRNAAHLFFLRQNISLGLELANQARLPGQ